MSELFFGGLPTEIDVKKLVDKYGSPSPGTLIPHDEIAEIIGAPWRSHRYRTVTNVWRRQLLKSHNIDTTVEIGIGIKILTAPERCEVVKSDFKGVTRKTRRVAIRTSVIPDEGLTDAQRTVRDHLRQVTSRMYMLQTNEVKALRPPPPAAALPRRSAEG